MAKHDENKDLKSFSRIGKVSLGDKTLRASKNATIGIHMWGKIDFLTRYCGWHFIWDNSAGVGMTKYDDNDNPARTDKKAKKIKAQKLVIKNLERTIAENKIAKIVDPEKIKGIKITELLEHVKKLKQDNNSLREKIGQYRKEISRLCNKLYTNEKTD